MAQKVMYPGMVNSPETTITNGISESDTIIYVLDPTRVPIPPNLMTLGTGTNAETVKVTEISGSAITVERGFQGIAKSWPAGTVIARNFTEYDYDALKSNVEDLDAGLTGLAGEGRTTETVKGNADTLTMHLADTVPHIPYVAVTGSSNTYAATLNPAPTAYTEGMALAIKVNVNNTGASTINVNGLGAKPIKKANGNDVAAGNLNAGSIYTLRYNGVNFILQGEGGSGNAIASDLLSGKTASTDAGDIVGTMPNQGAMIITPGTTNQTIPEGYHNGGGYVVGDADLVSANIKAGKEIFGVSGDSNVVDTSLGTAVAGDILSGKIAFSNGAQITGSMVNRGAYNVTPGTINKVIPAGYHNGTGIVYGDADLKPENIKSGVNLFGVVGTLSPHGTSLRPYDSGVENIAIVNGYSQDITGSGSVTKESNRIKFYYSGVGERSVVTDTTINLTNIKYILVDWEISGSYQPTLYLVASTTKIAGGDTSNAYVMVYDYARNFSILDVSSLSGYFYIRVHLISVNALGSGTGYLHRILLV